MENISLCRGKDLMIGERKNSRSAQVRFEKLGSLGWVYVRSYGRNERTGRRLKRTYSVVEPTRSLLWIRNWKAIAEDRAQCRRLIEEAKTYSGL